MAETPTIEAQARTGTGKGAARSTRREGLVPGVIYGGGETPVPIALKFNELLKMLKKGRFKSQLLTIAVDGKEMRVVCKDVQRDVVKDLPVHVDFQRLTERSRIDLYVTVDFHNQGACPGIRRGGTLNVVRHEVELNVRAGSIPEKIDVDLAGLQIGDSIKISNVSLPQGVTPTIRDRDFVIATIATPSGFVASDDEEESGEEEVAEAEEA